MKGHQKKKDSAFLNKLAWMIHMLLNSLATISFKCNQPTPKIHNTYLKKKKEGHNVKMKREKKLTCA